jgi:hypothetical protein
LIQIDLDVRAGVFAVTCWMPSVSRSPSAFWDLLFGSVIIYLRMRIVVVVDGEGAIKRFWIKSLTLGNTRLTTNDKVNTDGRFINEPYLLRGVTMVLQTSAVYVPLYCNSIINIGDSVVSYAPTTKCVCRRNTSTCWLDVCFSTDIYLPTMLAKAHRLYLEIYYAAEPWAYACSFSANIAIAATRRGEL